MKQKKIILICIIILLLLLVTMIVVGTLNFFVFREPNVPQKSQESVYEKNKTENDDDVSLSSSSNTPPDFVNSIIEKSKNVSGDVQWGVKFYENDYEYTTEFKPVPSASVIKVFIMEYVFDQEEQGLLSMNDSIAGSLVKNLLEKMITVSDNDATNSFINYFGMENLNRFFKNQNYTDTKIERRMLDTNAQKQGKDNYTSVKDVMMFLDKVYENKETYPYSEMLKIMLRQQRRGKIPARIPADVKIANKTGELSNVESDVGIVFTDNGDFSVAFLCTSVSSSSAAIEFINDATLTLYNNCMSKGDDNTISSKSGNMENIK